MSAALAPITPFEPGRNCWRVAHADRAAFLVDGEAYFKAFVAAARRAQRSIYIVGWDFHSRTRLLCGEGRDECELELGEFLNDLVRRRPGLQVHILIWDYPMIFGLEREWAPIYGLGWKPHRRIHFRYDNTQPIGASHHQKIVVIDDAIAFSGGIDLTCRRWDTCAHTAGDSRRMVEGSPYPPFHDLAMMVDGEAAASLGELVRERWRRATQERLVPTKLRHESWRSRLDWRRNRTGAAGWPEEVEPSVTNVEVAISRTEPASESSPGVREIEQLYLDMIAAARHSIYIENQYFTADTVGEALAARLAEPDGPEIVVVLRELSHGWLEELTMQTLRTRLIQRLRQADVHGRLYISYPYIAGLDEGTCIDVHAKLIIVDDDYVRIGSANLANRSMGLDTECDLAIHAAGREDVRSAIRALRSGLLAEHLGATPADVEAAVAETGSLRAAIERLSHEERTLKPLTSLPEVPDAVLDIAGVADPERPVELNDLVRIFNPTDATPGGAPVWRKIALVAVIVAALTAVWKYTPLATLLEPSRITAWAEQFGGQWWAPLIVLLAYTPACVAMFPRPLITLFAVVAFGPWLGFLYAMLGIQVAAWLTYVAGQQMNRGTVRRLAGRKLNAIIEVLRRRGLIAMTALRLVPLAPFAVEGLVAGAVRIKLWHFQAGTALGMLPGTLAATVFGDQLQALIEDRGSVNYWLIAAALLLLGAATWFVRRWLNSTTATSASHPSTSHHGVGNARAA
jgi:phospholipase D1/2